jgi:7-cyano-7-deazaguanine synthase
VGTPSNLASAHGRLRWRVEIAGKAFLDLLIEDSHSCYLGDRSRRHDWGYGCGTCPACQLRGQGFAKFKSRRAS